MRPWILQHFAGTLNLDIRRSLPNHLAENFTDINSIDWCSVVDKPEFAGHTTVSLRHCLSNILKNAKAKEGADITLKVVAEFANTKYSTGGREVPDKDLKRQQEIIEYFECYVKTNCLSF